MKTYKFMPEGWNSQIEELDMQKIYKYQTIFTNAISILCVLCEF